jgi:hypothetical protein
VAGEATLAEQYDVPGRGEGSEARGVAEAAPAGTTPGPAPGPAPAEGPPRDPQTGRFTSPGAGHSSTLVRLAFDLGLAPEEIDALDSRSLAKVVGDAQREQQAARRAATTEGALAGRQAPAGAAPAAASGGSAKELGLDAELEWDPSLVSLLGTLRSELASARAELAELKGHHVQQAQRTARQQVETVLARDYSDFMGPEPGPRATGKDAALAKRRALARYVSEELKDDPGSLEERVVLAMEHLFGQKAPGNRAAAARRGGPDEQQWREGALARPTHRAGAAEPPGREKAAASVARIMRENGISGGGPGSLGDEFPD